MLCFGTPHCYVDHHFEWTLQMIFNALMQVLPIQQMDAITAMLPVNDFAEDLHLLMLTEGGSIKRTPLSLFQDPSLKRGLTAIKLKVSQDTFRRTRFLACLMKAPAL